MIEEWVRRAKSKKMEIWEMNDEKVGKSMVRTINDHNITAREAKAILEFSGELMDMGLSFDELMGRIGYGN